MRTTHLLVPGGHAGDVRWSDPLTHSAGNLGARECHVLNVEPKAVQDAKK